MSKVNIQISQASETLTPIDCVSRALCQIVSGDPDRLYDGLFTNPYEIINTITLDPSKQYFFDAMTTGPEGQPQPQIKGFRFWGYQALPLLEELSNNGLSVTNRIEV